VGGGERRPQFFDKQHLQIFDKKILIFFPKWEIFSNKFCIFEKKISDKKKVFHSHTNL